MSEKTTLVDITCPDCGAVTNTEMRTASTFISVTCIACANPVVGYRGGDES